MSGWHPQDLELVCHTFMNSHLMPFEIRGVVYGMVTVRAVSTSIPCKSNNEHILGDWGPFEDYDNIRSPMFAVFRIYVPHLQVYSPVFHFTKSFLYH